MQPINARPLPDDRHACILWLSRAGFVPGADGSPVEAEPSPASTAARVAEVLLSSRLFPPKHERAPALPAPHARNLPHSLPVLTSTGRQKPFLPATCYNPPSNRLMQRRPQ